ncbi:tetratricopeptide repeat protein [Microcoleus sp. MON2_D5]|uniref:tetratricopeptide repeat protein n=1 Tax=Microcoleus sp. MON2_D5 TaxID=2818833 RepID=UPI002FD1E519
MTAASDLSIIEERKNLFSFLQLCQEKCLSQSPESIGAFKLLMKVWKEASDQFWYLGYWNDFYRCGNIALIAAKTLNDLAAQGQVFCELGWVCMEWKDYVTAQKYFDLALQNFQAIGNDLGQCSSLRYLGVLSYRQKNLDSAIKFYYKALKIVGDERYKAPESLQYEWAIHEASLHNLLGCYYLKVGLIFESYHQFNESIKKFGNLGEMSRYYQAVPLLNLGRWHFKQGDYEKARQYYQECYQFSKDVNRPDMVASVFLEMAKLEEVEGNKEEAIKLAGEAEHIAGTEITSVREQAAIFKEKLLSKTIF